MPAFSITDKEFHLIAGLIYEKLGIHLAESKKTLLVGRLGKYLSNRNLTVAQYYEELVADKTGKALGILANQVTTNHTFFNRESAHFEFFGKNVLPNFELEMKGSNNKDLRIWCAASSTGEEPLMIKLKMLEYFGFRYKELKAGMLATDISQKALSAAKLGVYQGDQFKDLDTRIISKYFNEQKDGMYQVSKEVLSDIHYAKFNLVTGRYHFKSPFHAIFCRNVMIYFDEKTKEKVVNSMYKVLRPGGYLFIGHAESLNKLNHPYKYIQPAVYRKV